MEFITDFINPYCVALIIAVVYIVLEVLELTFPIKRPKAKISQHHKKIITIVVSVIIGMLFYCREEDTGIKIITSVAFSILLYDYAIKYIIKLAKLKTERIGKQE